MTIGEAGLALKNQNPLETVLDFLSSRSRKSAGEVSSPAAEVFKGFASILDQLLTDIIEKRTAAEYKAAFADAFPKYFAMTMSLSQFVHVAVPHEVVDRLTRETICELEADFRDKALLAFGGAVRDQAIFTIWTLRKINDLLTQISAVKVSGTKLQDDEDFRHQFFVAALCAHFSLDCLKTALRLDRAIYPEVMDEITEGLRSMVNAYAWARRGLDLRVPALELAFETGPSDPEDEELLNASMLNAAMLDDESASNGD